MVEAINMGSAAMHGAALSMIDLSTIFQKEAVTAFLIAATDFC